MNENKLIKILAISGSLRTDSSNTVILKTIVNLAPANVQVDIFNGLAALPFFSPELDIENSSISVTTLRKLITEADGVLISTPEYAFGVPGVLKNALDWLVSSGELNEKPVYSISASPLNSAGEKALASLLLTLTALGTLKVGSLSIANIKNKIDTNKKITDKEILKDLKAVLGSLISSINDNRKQNIDHG